MSGPADRDADAHVCMGDTCPTCLKGPEWTALLEDLGKGRANRTVIPRMLIANWLSAELTHIVATILLQDTMGFTVNNLNAAWSFNFTPDELIFVSRGPMRSIFFSLIVMLRLFLYF